MHKKRMRRVHRGARACRTTRSPGAGRIQRGDRESAPDDSKIANRQYDDGNRCYYAADQAIEPLHGEEGLVILSIIPVSGGRDFNAYPLGLGTG